MKPEDTLKRNKFYHCLEYDHDQTGELCLISCGFEQCDGGVCYGSEVKDCFCLHAVLSGTGILRINGKVLQPAAGQLFLLKEGELAEYTADEHHPWKYCWIGFKGDEAGKMCEYIGFTDGIYCLDSRVEISEFYSLVYRMHEKPEMSFINGLYRRGVLLEFLALAMTATQSLERTMQTMRYSSEVYVKRAAEFIRYNYATINVTDVVEYVGFSRSYFSTLFRQMMGGSLQEFLMKCRIERSRELLEKTELSIQDIAAQVGYENPLSFSRAFKGTCGFSPAHYRQNMNKENEHYE